MISRMEGHSNNADEDLNQKPQLPQWGYREGSGEKTVCETDGSVVERWVVCVGG